MPQEILQCEVVFGVFSSEYWPKLAKLCLSSIVLRFVEPTPKR